MFWLYMLSDVLLFLSGLHVNEDVIIVRVKVTAAAVDVAMKGQERRGFMA